MVDTKTKVTLVGETAQFVANMTKANKAILQMGKKLSGLTTRFSKISKEFEEAAQKINKASGAFNKAGNSVKKAGSKAASSRKNFAKLGVTLRNMGTDMRSAANSMGRYGAVLLGAGAASGIFAAKFNQDMTRVTAISTGTTRGVGKDFDLLSKKALETASRTEHTADQIVQGMKFMAMAGFKPDAIVNSIDTIARVATAGGLSMAQSGNIVTNVMAGYGITLSNVEKTLRAENAEQGIFNQQMLTSADVTSRFRAEMESTANMLIGTFTNANVDLMQMGEAFKLAGSNAKLLDMPKEDLFAMIGLLGNVGIQGTEAGTALKRSFFAMMKTTEKSRAAMASFGLNKEDLQGDFGQLKVLQKLSGAMDAFTKKGKKLEFLTGLVEIFGERAGPKIAAALAQGTEEFIRLRDNIQESDWMEFGEKLEKQLLDTALGKLNILKSSFQNLAVVIGNALLPTIAKVSSRLTKFFNKLAKNKDGLAKIAKVLLGIGVALTSMMALNIAGWFLSWTGIAIGGITRVKTALELLTASMLKNKTVSSAVSAGGAFGGAIGTAFSTSKKMSSSAASARGSNIPTFIGTGSGLKEVAKKLGGTLKNTGGMFLKIGGLATTVFNGFMGTITAVGGGFATLVIAAGALLGGFTGLLATFGTMENASNKLKGVFEGTGLTDAQEKVAEQIGFGNDASGQTSLDKIMGSVREERGEVKFSRQGMEEEGELVKVSSGLKAFAGVLGDSVTELSKGGPLYGNYIATIKDAQAATSVLDEKFGVFGAGVDQSEEKIKERDSLALSTTRDQIREMQKEMQARRKVVTEIKNTVGNTDKVIQDFADNMQIKLGASIKGDISGEGFKNIVNNLKDMGVATEEITAIYKDKGKTLNEKLGAMSLAIGKAINVASEELGVNLASATEAASDAELKKIKHTEILIDTLAKRKSQLETIMKLEKKAATKRWKAAKASIGDLLNKKEFEKYVYLQKRSGKELSASMDALKAFSFEMNQINKAISTAAKSNVRLNKPQKQQLENITQAGITQVTDKAATDLAKAISDGAISFKDGQSKYLSVVDAITKKAAETLSVNPEIFSVDKGLVSEKVATALEPAVKAVSDSLSDAAEKISDIEYDKDLKSFGNFSDFVEKVDEATGRHKEAKGGLEDKGEELAEMKKRLKGLGEASEEAKDLALEIRFLEFRIKTLGEWADKLAPDFSGLSEEVLLVAAQFGMTAEEARKLNERLEGINIPEEDVIDPNAKLPETIGDIDAIKDMEINQEISDWVQDMFGGLGKEGGDAIGNEMAGLFEGIELPSGVGATIGGAVGTAVGSAFSAYGGAVWGPIVGSIAGDLVEGFAKRIPEFAGKALSAITGAFKFIASKLQQAGKFIFDSIKKFGENVKSGLMALGDYFPEERAGSAFSTSVEQLTPGGGVFNVGASIAAALAVVSIAALSIVPVLALAAAAMGLLAMVTLHFLPELTLLAVITGVLTGILLVLTAVVGTLVATFLIIDLAILAAAAIIIDSVIKFFAIWNLMLAAMNPAVFSLLAVAVGAAMTAIFALGAVIAAGIPAVIAAGIGLILAGIAAALTAGLAGVLTFFTALAFKDVEGPYVDEEGNVQEEFKSKRKDVKAAFSGALDPLIIALDSLWAGVMPLAGLFSALVNVMLPLAQGFSNVGGLSRTVFYALKNLAIIFATSMLAVGYFATGVLEVIAWLLENVPSQVNTFMDEFGKALLGGLAWILRGLADFAGALGLSKTAIITVADGLDEFSLGSAGDTLQDLADAARDLKPDLGAMALAIQELMNLTYEEALAIAEEIAARKNMDLSEFGEQLTNVPEGFRVNLARYLSLDDENPGAAVAGVSRKKLADMDPNDYFNRLGSEWSGAYGSGDPVIGQLKDDIERLTEVMNPNDWADIFGDVLNGSLDRTLHGFEEAFSRAADFVMSALVDPGEAFERGENNLLGGMGNNFASEGRGSVTNVYINDMNINDISSPADFGNEVARRVERDSMQQLGTPFNSDTRRGGQWGGGD
jgi:TP901 family phage tail tape measure protein